MHNVTAIIPAAGQGRRMNSDINKQFLLLKGKPVLAHTLEVFDNNPLIKEIVVVVRQEEIAFCQQQVLDQYLFKKVTKLVAGGKERVDSVAMGLRHCSSNTDMVVVHDGARPLLTSSLLNQVLETAIACGAAVAAVPVKDCIKEVNNGGVVRTLNRASLWAVQTPQAFKYQAIKAAYAAKRPTIIYDDATLMEAMGHDVKVVTGEYTNIKVTTPEDLKLASVFMGEKECE